MAAVCYAINALITKHLVGGSPRALAAAIVLVSAFILVPAAVIVDRPWTIDPSAQSIVAIVVLGILQTAIATLMMFALIGRQGASFFSQLNFMVPVFGVLWGALILAERPSLSAYVALAVILAGIAVARGRSAR
jgi:drug/metabolite transporter (DMT)-like permease